MQEQYGKMGLCIMFYLRIDLNTARLIFLLPQSLRQSGCKKVLQSKSQKIKWPAYVTSLVCVLSLLIPL